MDPLVHSLLLGLKLAYVACLCGAGFMLGAATICKWLNWAPVNVTVNLNDQRESQ